MLESTASTFKSICALALSPIFALALNGCSAAGSSSTGSGSKPALPAPGGHERESDQVSSSCDDIITQKKIDAFMASNTITSLGGLLGHGSVHCTSRKQENGTVVTRDVTGFVYLSANPVMQLSSKAEVKDDESGSFRNAEIEIESAILKPAEINTIAKAFVAHDGRFPQMVIGQNSWSAITLGNLPKTKATILSVSTPKPIPTVTSRSILKIAIPPTLAGPFQTALNSYIAGQTSIVLYTDSDLATGSILKGIAMADQPLRLADFKRVSLVSYLTDLWSRISALGPLGVEDKILPYSWMHEVVSLWPNLRIQPNEGRQEWLVAFSMANVLWNPRSARTTEIGIENSVKALRFLITLDPTNAAADYNTKINELSPFIYNLQDLYNEAVYLVESKVYTPAQEAVVVALAKRLSTGSHRVAQPWSTAKDMAARAKYSQDKIDFVFDLEAWLLQSGDRSGYTNAQTWIFSYDFERSRFAQLKDIHAFLVPVWPSQALQKAAQMVVYSKMTQAQTDNFKRAYVFLKTTSGSYRALDKAERYAAELATDRLDLLIAAHDWLKMNVTSSRALDKVERYIFNKHMTVDMFNNLKALFTKYDRAHEYDALGRAEREAGLS